MTRLRDELLLLFEFNRFGANSQALRSSRELSRSAASHQLHSAIASDRCSGTAQILHRLRDELLPVFEPADFFTALSQPFTLEALASP